MSTTPTDHLLQGAGRLADDEFRGDLAVNRMHRFVFDDGVDGFDDESGGGLAHDLHRLTNGGESRMINGGGGDVVEADHRALLGHVDARFAESADGAEGGHVVERHNGGKGHAAMQELAGELVAILEAGERVARFGQVDHQPGIDSKIEIIGRGAHATPARNRIDQSVGAANEGDLAMAEGVQVLEGGTGAEGVVDDDGADLLVLQFAADDGGGNFAFLEIRQHVDVEVGPVGEDDQTFDAAIEKHFQITLETGAVIVNVGENGEEGSFVQTVLDAAQDERAVGVGHVEDHHAHGVTAATAERAGEEVRAITELSGGALDTGLGRIGNVAG